ncbi:hypothetical protein LWM68_09300 [Niabella sp. W65]|nr:hypothetical protein [Niabella sp. W65]MCH7362946.1 hypothetical protein [Niabella sp. W65]ULT38890.1 hypothetical protein KRR40_27975 [Niabella sp. I65]
MKTKIITGAVHLLLISWLVLAGCNKENKSNFDVTADVRLQSFSINQQQGK